MMRQILIPVILLLASSAQAGVKVNFEKKEASLRYDPKKTSIKNIVKALKKTYDAWWEDIQPHMVNDHLPTVPETCKPYHELYRRDFGQQRYDEAMQLMTWTGGKPYGPPRKRRKRD